MYIYNYNNAQCSEHESAVKISIKKKFTGNRGIKCCCFVAAHYKSLIRNVILTNSNTLTYY